MINPFKGVESAWRSLDGKNALSLGAHNTIKQASQMSYGSASAWGAGIGAAYGGVEGALSYDGSFLGGAFHGGMVGAVGGVGLRGAAGLYNKGAAGATTGNSRFAWKNFSDGWNATGE